VYQFPIVVCFAATTHKFQGGNVLKPNKIAVDLRTVFEDAMTYVMLSRVQAKAQLFIVGCLPEKKFRTNMKCLEELEKLKKRSINHNPSKWLSLKIDSTRVSILNCHSLAHKITDIKNDSYLLCGDIICLSETWLSDDIAKPELDIDGFKLHLNSFGKERGKGLAIYYRDAKFAEGAKIKFPTLQISCFSSVDLGKLR